jgi:hypothetical protein
MIPAALFAEKNRAAEWQQYFGENSEPVADAGAYQPFVEVRGSQASSSCRARRLKGMRDR